MKSREARMTPVSRRISAWPRVTSRRGLGLVAHHFKED